jgi:hypothetical protein
VVVVATLGGSSTYGGTVGNFFQVDLDVLNRFITSLRESGDHMESALNALKSMDGGKIGTAALNEAADHFQHTWRYGLGQLKEKVKDTNEGVRAAHGAYQETEQALSQALGQVAQALAGGK